MVLRKDYIKADTHVHFSSDIREGRITADKLLEEMSMKGVDGAIVLVHAIPKTYIKDYHRIKKFCKHYSNLIPGVEINKEVNLTLNDKNYAIKCHTTYLGEIPAEDIDHGSWFSHVNKPGGLFDEANRAKIDEKFFLENISKNFVIESTADLFNALSLKSMGFKTLLGTDAHPDKKGEYKYLGHNGIIINSTDFNYKNFMEALKSDEFGYFSIIGSNYYYITLDCFLEDKIIIKKN